MKFSSKNKNLNLIVCIAENNLIGDRKPKGNGMLWHIKEELLYFKEITMGNTLLFGASTAKVVPIEIMKKNREIIVLHRNMNLPKLIDKLSNENKDIFICGGYSIYKYFLDNFNIDKIYLSKIKKHILVDEAEEPLYLPDIENYGYEMKVEKEFNDFTAYIYEPKNK